VRILTLLLLLAAGAYAQAQPPAANDAPRRERAPLAHPEDLEPAVDVGRTRLAVAQRPTAPEPSVPAPAPAVRPTAPVAPSAAAPAPPSAVQPSGRAAPREGTSRVVDTIDLGTTSITGNQELPKVLYIVPWKKSDLGDLVGRPVNTLLDEVLAPVDPEVFERHLKYYETLNGKRQEE
jgi:hypothetical protein